MDSSSIQITRPARVPVTTIAAVVIALLVGAALGSLITNAMRGPSTPPVVTTWDAQKLDAMAGRQLFTATPVPAIPWDQQKLDAMAARQLAP